jgi:G3E family GTPase
MEQINKNSIPVNIFTGFLGSGKTTIIKNLLLQLEHPENVVWLKNEYGDENIDAKMLEETNVQPKEILNGCLCCVLVGRLGDAIAEILEQYNPDRIIIETSGTAWPAPIVWEVNRVDGIHIDSVVTIVDAINFAGYDDVSYAAEMQNKFVDLVVINKYPDIEPASKDALDLEQKLDDVYSVFKNEVPKVKTKDGNLDIRLLIGLDSKSMNQLADGNSEHEHHNGKHEHPDSVETFKIEFSKNIPLKMSKEELDTKLNSLKEKGFIRIKGFVKLEDGDYLINWVLGRGTIQKMKSGNDRYLLVFMGKNTNKYSDNLRKSLTN